MSNEAKKEVEAPKHPKNIPFVPEVETKNLPKVPGDEPAIETYSGHYIESASGQEFALSVVEYNDARDGRTHFAKNSQKFWNGTADEFKAQFEKK
jgi:hypothetical protein